MRILMMICLWTNLWMMASAQVQVPPNFQEVERRSIELYLKGAWPELLDHGRMAITSGHDYLNLRLRMGYAAFMTGRYAEAVRQYDRALGFDSYNTTAHEYLYFSRKYMGQSDIAAMHTPFLTQATRQAEQLDRPALTEAGAEFSRKITDHADRGDHNYGHIMGIIRFGHRVQVLQLISGFGQQINEPLFVPVAGGASIRVAQTGFYNRTRLNLDRKRQLVGAVHYLATSFGTLRYENFLAMAGMRWYGDHFTIQADGMIGRMTDTATRQANVTLQYMPKGNMDLYGITVVTAHHRNKTGFNIRQVVGGRLYTNTWLEGHATLGTFRNFAESDGRYIYNSIDETRLKAGLTTYWLFRGGLVFEAGYTLEQRKRFGWNETYLQHSITGGITWRQ